MPTTTTVTAELYDSFIAAFGDEIISLDTDQLYFALVTASYTPNKATDTYWSTPQAFEPSGAGYTAGGIQLTGTSWLDAVYSCDSPSWASLSLTNVRYLVIYDKTSGSGASTYRLVGYIDLGSGQNLSGQPLAITLPGRQLLTLLSGSAAISAVTVANITDASTLGRELLTAPDAPTARSYLGRSWPFPMARNTIAAVGDSVTYGGSFDGYTPSLGQSYLQQLQVLSHQRIRFGGGNFAVPGTAFVDAQTSQLPHVLAMNPLPGACVIAPGTNDLRIQTAPNPTFTTMVASLKSIVASLLAAGIVPILWCVPPDEDSTPLAANLYQGCIHQWNTYIRRYAALNGFPLIDAHSALAQIDGTFLPGAEQSSLHIHPNGTGQRLIAEKALADGLADWFPPNSLVNTARQLDDLSNMFNDGTINLGLHTTDSNSDGVADGWTATGTATKSLVAPVVTDDLHGNWQQISASTGQTGTLTHTFTSGWSVGDVIAFSSRVQSEGFEAPGDIGNAGWEFYVETDTPGGFVAPNGTTVTTLVNGTFLWEVDLDDGELYVEFTVISAMTNMKLNANISQAPTSGTAKLRIGEVTVRNLTTGGLLI